MTMRRSLGRASHLRDESGLTLPELAVSMMVMGIVAAAFLSILSSVQMSLVREAERSQTLDQARLAMQTLDREIRSGEILCAASGGSLLSVYTQSNGTTRWVQYRVQSGSLQRREKPSASWESWRTAATNIVNGTVVPFTVDTSATLGSRVVNVALLVNADPDDDTASDVRMTSSLAIRNQSSAITCSALPSG